MKEKVVTFGEIMLRLASPGYLRFNQTTHLNSTFGGGEANVAVSLANYGMHAQFVSRLPQNPIGDWCIGELKRHNVDTSKIIRGGDRVGIYFLETGAVARASNVVYDRAHSSISTIPENDIDWYQILKGATWFHWTGITPAISQEAARECLKAVKIADELGVKISTDLNYRKKLWKWGKQPSKVMEELVSYCDVILGNEEDAEKVFGIHPIGTDVTSGHVEAEGYISVCKQLMKKFPKASKIVITLRGSHNANHNSWSGVLFNGKKLFIAPQYEITHIVDRVGGGDSFMGGLIYGLLNLDSDQKALNFATAASFLKHTVYGDFNLVSVNEVTKLMGGDASGRVSR